MSSSNTCVIFDVDGTVCDTVGIDDECFCATASALLGTPIDASSWETCPNVTDAGIVDWFWKRYRGRQPTPSEVVTFVDNFATALRRRCEREPERFQPIRGAPRLIEHLRASAWSVAFATGGWALTSRLKLRAAGLPTALLLASSDDSHGRCEIFRLAHMRARAAWPDRPIRRTILVGDGAWDVAVAAELGWAFVGVGQGERAAALRRRGATTLISDFDDLDVAVSSLAHSEVPLEAAPPPAQRVESAFGGRDGLQGSRRVPSDPWRPR